MNYFVVLTFADGDCDPIVSECALVNIGEIPVIDDIEETICSRTSFSLLPIDGGGVNGTDIVPIATEYSWTVNASTFVTGASAGGPALSISQTLENTTNTPQTVTYTVTPISTAIGNCEGETFDVIVTVNPTPTIVDKTLVVCSSDPISWTLPDSDGVGGTDIIPVNTTYSWTFVDNSNVTGESSGGPSSVLSQVLINDVHTSQDVIYQLTPISSLGCEGIPFILTVTVDPVPLIADKSTEICSEETFTIDPQNNLPTEIVPANTLYTWVVVSPPPTSDLFGWSDISVGQSTISQTLTNNLPIAQTLTYLVTPTSGTCEGSTFEIEVTILPTPDVTISVATQTECSGETFASVEFTSSVAGTIFEYTLQNTTVPAQIQGYEFNITGTGNFPSLILTNGLLDPYTQVITKVRPLKFPYFTVRSK